MTLQVTTGGIAVIAVSVVGALVLGLLAWRLMSRSIDRLFAWVDALLPVEISPYAPRVSRGLALVVEAGLASAVVLTVLTQLGVDTTGVQQAAKANGAAVARWLGPRLLRLLLIAVLAALATRVAERVTPGMVRRFLTSRRGDDAQSEEAQKRHQTLSVVLVHTLRVFILVVAFFTVLDEFNIPVGPILASAGIVGIAIGLGAQSLVRDIIAGIFILLEDQYRVGDVVRIAGIAGLVEDINLRRTVLRDLDFIQHYIPNGQITTASNFTKEKSRVNLDIEVAYKEDLDRVMEVINRVGGEMSQDPYFGPLITEPIKALRVNAFNESGIAIKVLGETLPLRQWEVAGEFRRRIKRAFDEEGIQIPFPHRTLYWGVGAETVVRPAAGDGRAEETTAEATAHAPQGEEAQSRRDTPS